jgi:L-lysine exporter family protein LysE/ArgO
MTSFIQGILMGLAYVAPLGMQNMFVINTALTRTKLMAFLTAGVVVFFDVTLSLACFLGVGAVMEKWPYIERAVLLVGSLVVLCVGFALLRERGGLNNAQDAEIPVSKVVSTACVVTWFNPQAILDGTMLLGAFRATMPGAKGWAFLAGVMTASTVWFFGITLFLRFFANKFTPRLVRAINIVSGGIIILYGLKLLLTFFTA